MSEFLRRSAKENRRLTSHCKVCIYARQREYNRRTGYRSQKAYDRTEKGRSIHSTSATKWRKNHPEKFREYTKNSKRKRRARDPVGFREKATRSTQIYKLRKRLPEAPREIVVAIVDARRSIHRVKKSIAEAAQKDQ